jgi:hypothetical protein
MFVTSLSENDGGHLDIPQMVIYHNIKKSKKQ